ncbi:MAG: Uncharacterised protein [Methanobacteriota archaeon]|nr:MAG: Uncharacterised protein [Euryarchaeota archaeon]
MAATDSDSLGVIGALLMIAVGALTLFFVRKNENLEWNERFAAHILCWTFIAKGIGNSMTDSVIARYETGDIGLGGVWQFEMALMWGTDYLFSCGMILLAMVFPVPITRTKKQFKIGCGLVLLIVLIRLTLLLVGEPITVFELPGLSYLICGLIWGSVYAKFRLDDNLRSRESSKNIANIAGLLILFQFGHIWFSWPGLLLRSEYFYNFDLWLFFSSNLTNFMWQSSYAFAIATGFFILGMEIWCANKGRSSMLTYVYIGYFSLGLIGYSILGSDAQGFWYTGSKGLSELWNTLTSSMHFTMMRPMIGMYIIMRYGLFETTPEMKPRAKIMVIILIVIATSAFLELVQAILPIPDMFSAALLGILVALGIGWEEKSFDALMDSSSEVRKGHDPRWFPELLIPRSSFVLLDRSLLVLIVSVILIAFLQWQTDAIYNLAAERMGMEGYF